MTLSCDFCGALSEEPTTPLTWSLAMDRGRVRRYCEECTRAHVRAMEGKLEQESW